MNYRIASARPWGRALTATLAAGMVAAIGNGVERARPAAEAGPQTAGGRSETGARGTAAAAGAHRSPGNQASRPLASSRSSCIRPG